jgi:uncharacterized protein (DUF1697 family)
MTVYVSLLRAVNVGGHGVLKMEALKELYRSIGLQDVRTILQSGNVLFRSNLADRAALATRLRQEIERRFELRVEVLIRTLAELEMLVERGPELSGSADPRKLHVMFLSGVPDAKTQAVLTQAHKGPELLEIRGPEVYLYYPDGAGRSKLSGAFIEAKLNLAGTARNWNTIMKLIEAGREIDGGAAARAGGAAR